MSSALPLLLPTEGAADRLTEAAARAERDKERVVLIRDGKPVAAVVPIEDLEALEAECKDPDK
jgi:prevent-host-death family protein